MATLEIDLDDLPDPSAPPRSRSVAKPAATPVAHHPVAEAKPVEPKIEPKVEVAAPAAPPEKVAESAPKPAIRKVVATMVSPVPVTPPPVMEDKVVFKPGLGPDGILKVINVDKQTLTLKHEDKSVWECSLDAVEVVRSGKTRKVNLDGPARQLGENQAPVDVETLTRLGFRPAPKEDFYGAGDKTYFLDSPCQEGLTTLVYDLQPPGRQQPAAHIYYTSTDGNISVGLACFNARSTISQLHEMVSLGRSVQLKKSVEDRSIPTMADLVERIKTEAGR